MISRLPKWVWFGGAVLAFVAGMINAVAFLSFTHQAATHVTGIFTHLSMDIYGGKNSAVFQSAVALLSFFLGAALSGFIVKDAHLRMGRRYSVALLVESSLLVLSMAAFHQKSIRGEYFACMAAGLQNAMVSTYSGMIVRTTHMTGVLTDLGALVGQFLAGVKIETKRLKLLGGILLAFFWGGYLGAVVYSKIHYLTMLIPAFITASSAIVYLVIYSKLKSTKS